MEGSMGEGDVAGEWCGKSYRVCLLVVCTFRSRKTSQRFCSAQEISALKLSHSLITAEHIDWFRFMHWLLCCEIIYIGCVYCLLCYIWRALTLVLLLAVCCVCSSCKRSGHTQISNMHDVTLTHVGAGLLPHAQMWLFMHAYVVTLRWSCNQKYMK